MTTEPGCGLTDDLEDADLERAVAAAREADVAVLALGGASLWFTGERTEGEASDTADISLPAAQVRLAEAAAAAGTPLVVVLVQGRPYALPEVIQTRRRSSSPPYAGRFGTRSFTDVLFGVVNPSGNCPTACPGTVARFRSITTRRPGRAIGCPYHRGRATIWIWRRRRCGRSPTA